MILNIYLRINPYLHYIEAFWLAQVSINKTNKYLISVVLQLLDKLQIAESGCLETRAENHLTLHKTLR